MVRSLYQKFFLKNVVNNFLETVASGRLVKTNNFCRLSTYKQSHVKRKCDKIDIKIDFVSPPLLHTFSYSLRSASIGFNFAALCAGNSPKVIPIVNDILNAAIVHGNEYTG